MGELWRRVWFLLNRARFERELREEMDAHRAMSGHSDVPFGNSLRLRDEAVDAWGWRWLDRLAQDVRFGARLLWRAPAFTLTAVAVLAVGVGVNLGAFQVFDRIALSPRPVRDAQTLVNLYRRSPNSTSTTFSGFKSRCTTPRPCACASPEQTWLMISTIRRSGGTLSRSTSSRSVVPSKNSIAK